MKVSRISTASGELGVIQIGFGLIGTAIDEALSAKAITIETHRIQWSNIEETINQLAHLTAGLSDLNAIEIIWAAGKAGFSADDDTVDAELTLFRSFISALNDTLQSHQVRCWMMSSAGGLHEGQICITSPQDIIKARPYSRLKYEQEQIVQSHFNHHVICRISSVYTVNNLSGRLGLLPVLMLNGIQHKVSTLVGSESTLRDYVLDRDIAQSIYQQILYRPSTSGIHYFVNGSPTSIKTIKEKIESIILKKLYIKYASVKSNAANITFLKTLKSEIFYSSPLSTNIKQLYHTLLSHRN